MENTIEIPEGYEARIEGNKVILELKESEDERIREAIESIIRVYGKTQGEWIAGYDMDTLVVHLRDAFAYLERQKEQKPESCDCSRDEESYTNGIHHVLMNPEAYGLIKQKPAEWRDTDMNEARNNLISVCRDWERGEHTTLLPVAAVHARYFLEHLTEPKPAEWSEAEKMHFANAILAAEKEWGVNSYTARWLESLRDNYKKCNSRWKPSDEQMAALLNAEGLVRTNNYPENAKILASLYEDLKKL